MTINMTLENIHPTTASCLEILQQLALEKRVTNILDMGCGDGILSFFSAALWPESQLVAVDISPSALVNAEKAAHQHQLDARITFIRSDCFSAPEIAQNGPYDLIICNLLAEPIATMRDHMSACLKPDGFLLCSGLLAWLTDPVCEHYQAANFTLLTRHIRSPWHSLLFCQKNS